VNGSVLPEDVLRDAPSYTPHPHELADLELLLAGAYAPLTGFLGRADLTALARRGTLADGTSWPVAVTLEIPAEMAEGLDLNDPLRRTVVLTDPEGAPVAAIEAGDAWPTSDGRFAIGGTVTRLGEGGQGPFQRLRRPPEEVRALLPPGRVLGVIADRPLHRPQLAQIAHAARTLAAHLLILIPVTGPGPDGLPPEALVRAIFAARDRMPPATIVAV
jgi:sulfate adenylyltransferase